MGTPSLLAQTKKNKESENEDMVERKWAYGNHLRVGNKQMGLKTIDKSSGNLINPRKYVREDIIEEGETRGNTQRITMDTG